MWRDTGLLFISFEWVDYQNRILSDLKWSGLLDTSNVPLTHSDSGPKSKAKLCKLKGGCDGTPHTEWVLLKPKQYSMKSCRGIKKRTKGLRKVVVKNEISHEDYLEIYLNFV